MASHSTGSRPADLLRTFLLIIWLAALIAFGVRPALADTDEFMRQIERVEQLVTNGDFPVALALADSLLDAAENRDPPEPRRIASALDARVSVQLYLGGDEAADAVETARRAVELREEFDGDPSIPLSISLQQLSVLLRQREQYEEARSNLDRALEIATSTDPPDSSQMSACLGELSTLCTETSEYTAAMDYFERDVAIAERIYAPGDLALVRKWVNVARLYRRLADYDNALRHCRRAEEMLSASDPRHAMLAYVYTSLGATYGEMGKPRESYAAYQLAIDITLEEFGEENWLMLSLLNDMGVYYFEILDYEKAEAELVKALELGRKLGSEETAAVAIPMANLASVYQGRGDYTEAEDLYVRSLEILEGVVGPDHPIVAQRLQELGWVRINLGEPEQAEADFQRSWEIRTTTFAETNFEIGQALTGRARARHDQGKFEEAAADYEAGFLIIESNMGQQHPFLIQPLVDHSMLMAERGRHEDAVALALRAETVSRTYLLFTSSFLSEQEALQFSTGRVKGTDLLFTLAASGTGVRTAYDQLVRSRALVLDEMAARRSSLVDTRDPDALEAKQAVSIRSREYAELLTGGPDSGGADEYQSALRTARTALEESQRALAEVSARYRRDQMRRQTGMDEVLEILPDRSVLVSYVLHRDMLNDSGTGDRSRLDDRPEVYTAFVVVGGTVECVTIGPALEIDPLVREWRLQAAIPPDPDSADAAARYAQAAGRLRARIWEPVSAYTGEASWVFVVPDAELHLVNWSVLTTDEGEFLAEVAPPIHYLSAERDLIQTDAEGAGLLAVGGVDYDSGAAPPGESDMAVALRGAATDADAFARIRFEALPGTASEIDAVCSIWSGGAGGQDAVTVLTGAGATEAAFRSESTGKRIVHLATHAFVLGENSGTGEGSRGIGAVADLEAPSNGASAVGSELLRLSGLALAGANLRGEIPAGADDGILTAHEVAAQDLGSVEWAVLSACDTGRGEIRVGEGVLGLRRAFQIAGVRTLIMSLWPVEDQSTEEWMRALYQARFEAGLTTIEAVRAASLEVLRARRTAGLSDHPFYWGGFVAAGSWK